MGAARRVTYGSAPLQVGDLWMPSGAGPFPVLVLIHGGFWRAGFDLTLMDSLAADAVTNGWALWNIDYRPVGVDGGGWPGTFEDVAAAVDHLVTIAEDPAMSLDLDRVAVAGHSAGGHLAAWVASRSRIPSGEPGADPAVVTMAAVSQAGVLDLRTAVADRVGQTATVDLMGATPEEQPDRYDVGSPIDLLPTGLPVRCVHGRQDDIVPIDQSERYVAAAIDAGDAAVLAPFDGSHFDILDPTNVSWTETVTWLRDRFGG